MRILIVLLALSLSAFSWSDVTTAISGHFTDIKERIFVENELLLGAVKSKGTFTYTKDALHWAKGDVSIQYYPNDYYVQLESNFEAGLAPDLYIVLSNKTITNQMELDKAPKTTTIKLKKGKGSTYYEIPYGLDVKSVVIWCKQFNQFMGSAVL